MTHARTHARLRLPELQLERFLTFLASTFHQHRQSITSNTPPRAYRRAVQTIAFRSSTTALQRPPTLGDQLRE